MMAEKTPSLTRITTGPARFSYAHIWEAHSMPNKPDDKKFSLCLLFPKTDIATYKKLSAAQEAAKQEGKAGTKNCNWGGKIPPKLELALKDGDIEKPGDPIYAGMWFINAKSTTKPAIVDKDMNEIIDKTECKSGDYGRANVSFYPYDVTRGGKNGIAVSLNSVQKLKDGAALGFNSNPAEDFAENVEDFDTFGNGAVDEDDDDLS